ncbi:hypothetical protein [Luteolibacter sp. LG18]|uniref:hypothetical protein n=1 Tax=Luteolibacter sp. LG18 TaxID=2819286 RepID=UPI002B2F4CDD|nr:hypothetical protein llg_15310 [Luteolibacter sp. LG18]
MPKTLTNTPNASQQAPARPAGSWSMKAGAWVWGIACLIVLVTSGCGWLIRVPAVLLFVPAGLFALGAGSFCIGRPGMATPGRAMACAFAALMALLSAGHLPLRAVFAGSRNAMDLAASEAAGGRLERGTWIGLYRIESSQVDADGNVFLWTCDGGNGRCGFVKAKSPKIPGTINEVDLGDGWRCLYFRDDEQAS